MAGVTFLAFGNGSPDVFSTFAAVRSNSGSLAIGELIGAAGFITAVVSGSMALVRPFKVARRSFVRDVGFFIIAIAFSMVFVANGSLELWECATMVGYYVFYVLFVVVWHWWLARRRKRREQQDIARGYYVDTSADAELDFEADYHDDVEAPRTRRATRTRHPTETDMHELVNDEVEREDFDELDEETERDKWMGELSSNMRLTRTPIGERRNVFNPIRPSLVGALEFQSVLHGLRKATNGSTPQVHLRRFSDSPALTLFQQRPKAHSTTSTDPHPTSQLASRSPSPGPSHSNSQLDGHTEPDGMSNRGRARSANAADLLGLSPSAWRGRQRSRSNLSSPRPHSSRSLQSDRENLIAPGQEQGQQPVSTLPPPLLLVEPPEEERSRAPPPMARPRAGTSDLLAPPSPDDGPVQQAPSLLGLDGAHDEPGNKPQLRITPPTPLPDVQQFPSLRSPSQSSGSRSPTPRDFLLGDTIPSPEEMYPLYPHPYDTPKPLRWWPYTILPAPEAIYRTLFPTVQRWREKNWLAKITAIVSAPSFFLLTITLPVVEPATSGIDQQNKEIGSAPTTLDTNKVSLDSSNSFVGPEPDALPHIAVTAEAQQNQKPPGTPLDDPSQPAPVAENHPHAAIHTSRDWDRWLVLVQCFTGPYFVLLVVWANFLDTDPDLLLMPSVYCVIGSSIACGIVLLTTRSDRPPRWHFVLCFVGFAVSVAWISSIADEVVGVLKAIGVIFDISDAILGLTIFAVGNSMGDLVADITVARLGYPVMALSACFGGPMLNILLGVGLSGLYMVIHKADHRHHKHPDEDLKFRPYKIEVSTTLMVSAVALLVTLVGLLIVIPLNRWTMDRRIGWGLIVLWVLATAGNLGVELSGLGKAEV